MTKIEPLVISFEASSGKDIADIYYKLNEVIEAVNEMSQSNDVCNDMIKQATVEMLSIREGQQRLSIAATILAGMMVNHCGEDADGGAIVALQYADALIKAGVRHE